MTYLCSFREAFELTKVVYIYSWTCGKKGLTVAALADTLEESHLSQALRSECRIFFYLNTMYWATVVSQAIALSWLGHWR